VNDGGKTPEEWQPVTDLLARRQQAMATALTLTATAAALVAAATDLCSTASELRVGASGARRHTGYDLERSACRSAVAPFDREAPYCFTVRGIVDGYPTIARWRPDHLDCDHELLQRVQVIVAMGEEFTPADEPGPSVPASTEGPPLAVLLTVMRAFTRITSIDVRDDLFEDARGRWR
jgi:hypothetical protein